MSKYNFKYPFFIIFFSIYCAKSLFFSLSIEDSQLIYITKNIANTTLLSLAFLTFFLIPEKKWRFLFVFFLAISSINIILGNKNYFNYIITISLLLLSSQINWNKLIKSLFIIYLSNIFILSILSSFLSYYFLLDDRFGYRFTAGFENPNTLSIYLLTIFSITISYIETTKISKGIIFTISIFLYFITIVILYLSFSRTGLVLLTLLYICHTLTLLKGNSRLLIHRKMLFMSFLFITTTIIAFQFSSILYFQESTLIQKINHILSGRIWHAYNIYSELGIPKLFGQNIENYLPIDFYFINTIYSIGWLPTIILIVIVLKKIYNLKSSLFMSVSLLLFIILTLTESYFSVLFYSISLFIIFHKNTHIRN